MAITTLFKIRAGGASLLVTGDDVTGVVSGITIENLRDRSVEFRVSGALSGRTVTLASGTASRPVSIVGLGITMDEGYASLVER
mgnify:CR=1 FL=1